jgi:hypothetical protein
LTSPPQIRRSGDQERGRDRLETAAHREQRVALDRGGAPARWFQNAEGIFSADYTKDATDPTWTNDPAF